MQKKRRSGITVDKLGTHIVTNYATLGQVTAVVVIRSAETGKGKGKQVQTDNPGPSERPPTFHEDLRAFKNA